MSKITYIASGEANFYTLMRDGNWLATMQFNGKLLVPAQETLLAGMIAGVPGQADHGSIKDRAAQLAVDMNEMADLHAGNGDTPAAEEFSQGAELVATMAAEIERLTHERDTLGQAIGEAVVKAGIAVAGMPLNGPQLLMLVNDLAECQLRTDKDAERHRFARDLVTSEEFQIALEPHIEWLSEENDPTTGQEHDAVTDRVIQIAKDHGLWPIKPEPELTDEAQADRDDFESYKDESGGCRCHLNPPCGYCTHPGNPLNQEDPSCWKVLP